jgi:hypothetical protein
MSRLTAQPWPLALACALVAACTLAGTPTGSPGATTPAGVTPSPSPSRTDNGITFPPSPSAGASVSASPSGSPSASASGSPTESASLGPSATPTLGLAEIVRFRRENYPESGRNQVDCTRADFDGLIHLVWQLRNATGASISIDGPGIYQSYSGLSGADDVPFTCDPLQHTYTLTTFGGVGGDVTETRTIKVAQPRIIDFAISGGTCADAGDTFDVVLTYQIANATGVELRVDGADEPIASYSGKSGQNLPAGSYSCAQPSQTYELTTTGGWGSAASATEIFSGYGD